MNKSIQYQNRMFETADLRFYLLQLIQLLSFLVLIVLQISTPALAQQVDKPIIVEPTLVEPTLGAQPTVDLKSLSTEDLLLYLANEKVAAAGLGFISAQLGDPLTSIINIWGEPRETRQDGILGSTELLYQPDPNLLVVFTGKDIVKSISIKGNAAALFRTARGARFGSPAQTIAQIYANEEVKVKKSYADFKKLGIRFYFSSDQLNKVIIYSPEED